MAVFAIPVIGPLIASFLAALIPLTAWIPGVGKALLALAF